MFYQFESNVKATICFLKLLSIKVNASTINETLQNHPDWPSMLSISDSLKKWNVPNAAGKIESKQIDHIPVPFIAYTNNREYPLAVVSHTDDTSVQFYSKNYSKPTIINKDEFVKSWTGIYLMAEPNNESGEKDYSRNKKEAIIRSIIPAALFLLMALLSFVLLYKTINRNSSLGSFNVLGIYFQYLLSFAGVIVTSLLLWYEIDKNNPLLQKVCTGIAKGNCNAILTSKKSKVFNWLSWSEVGFFYFTGGFLLLVCSSNNINYAISLLGVLNVLALPYIVFSVYYQWRVAKQWCVLCLAVQSLLLLAGINTFSNNLLTSFSEPPGSFILNAVFIYFLPVLLWFTIKPYILHLQEAKNTKREYLRIKFNTQIFETLLKKQKAITASAHGIGIDIGNPDAINTLIKVCNPYCGPCAKAHPKIDKLLEETPNLKVKIIFTTPNDSKHFAFNTVSHLLAISEQRNIEANIKKALDDWYLADKKDYENFAAKYPINGELANQGSKIEAMDKWCKGMGVSATPTIFINGNQLPDVYNIEDLQYFLLE